MTKIWAISVAKNPVRRFVRFHLEKRIGRVSAFISLKGSNGGNMKGQILYEWLNFANASLNSLLASALFNR
jgi:hypothetical protein